MTGKAMEMLRQQPKFDLELDGMESIYESDIVISKS